MLSSPDKEPFQSKGMLAEPLLAKVRLAPPILGSGGSILPPELEPEL